MTSALVRFGPSDPGALTFSRPSLSRSSLFVAPATPPVNQTERVRFSSSLSPSSLAPAAARSLPLILRSSSHGVGVRGLRISPVNQTERVRFELTLGHSTYYRFSKPAPSATWVPLRLKNPYFSYIILKLPIISLFFETPLCPNCVHRAPTLAYIDKQK